MWGKNKVISLQKKGNSSIFFAGTREFIKPKCIPAVPDSPEGVYDQRANRIFSLPTLKISFFKNSNYDSFRNCTSDVSKVELKTQKTIVIDHYSGLGIQQNRSWEGSWSTFTS